MGDVTAVMMDVITEKSGHSVTPLAVSVCTTPAAPSPLPIPYPVVASSVEGIADELGASGATLIGASSPVAVGDYMAGPSHVLPTGGGARFGSPLGVYDFVARTSLIRYSPAALRRQGPHIAALARAEGLDAHARAVEIRLEQGGPAGGSAESGT